MATSEALSALDEKVAAKARRGLCLILSSPSGAGKTTLGRALLEQHRDIMLSISVTTRAKRGSEIDGVAYHFIAEKDFIARRDRGDLLEWAEVHGNYYGTPREAVEKALENGRDVLFDIDWQGTQQLYETLRDDIVSIFVLPPSARELKARLERRAEDAPAVIARRLANARVEIGHWREYDYVLINDDLDRCFRDVEAILTAARLNRERRPMLESFIRKLDRDLGDLTEG